MGLTPLIQVVGENPDEGNGGQIRATLLSNRATAFLKVCQPIFNSDLYHNIASG